MKRFYLVAIACSMMACCESTAPKLEPEVNTVADTALLFSLKGFPVEETKQRWTEIFNVNMGKYWKAKQDCNDCLLPKSQYFLMSQTNLIAGYGEIVL